MNEQLYLWLVITLFISIVLDIITTLSPQGAGFFFTTHYKWCLVFLSMDSWDWCDLRLEGIDIQDKY